MATLTDILQSHRDYENHMTRSIQRWIWDKQRSQLERTQVTLGPPVLIDILASIGDRDDRGGGEEPTRGEQLAPYPHRRRCTRCLDYLGMQNPHDTCDSCRRSKP